MKNYTAFRKLLCAILVTILIFSYQIRENLKLLPTFSQDTAYFSASWNIAFLNAFIFIVCSIVLLYLMYDEIKSYLNKQKSIAKN